METRIERWDNQLALRIPDALAAEIRLRPDSVVELTVQEGQLVVRPVRRRPTLDELLARVTDENIHPEVDTGPPVGNEAW